MDTYKYIKLTIVIILCLLHISICQTINIYGSIIDSLTLEPIINTHVSSGSHTTVSDQNGYFHLKIIKSREIWLTIDHIGYERYKKHIQLDVHTDEYYTILLKPRIIPLDQISVIGHNKNTISNLSRSYLYSQDIRYAPSAGEPDLLRAVHSLPGISNTNDYNLGFYVRGGNRDQNRILIDGIPVFNPYHMMGIFSTFDSEAIQLSEIQKGSVDPEYGNVLSSVTTIRLRDGKANTRNYSYNVSLLSTRFRVEGPHTNGSYMLSVRTTYLDKLTDLFSYLRILPNDLVLPYGFIDGMGKYVYKPDPRKRIQLTTYWGRDTYDLSKLDFSTDENRITWGNYCIGLQTDHQISPGFSKHSHLSYSDFYSNWEPIDTSNSIQIYNKISAITGKYFLLKSFNNNSIIKVGIEISPYMFNFRIKGLSYTPLKLRNEITCENSVFGSIKIPLLSKFELTAGSRLTHFSYLDQFAVSPLIKFNLSLSETNRFNVQWNQNHQGIMTIGNEEVILTMFEAWLPVPKNLGIMSANQLAVGYEHKFNANLSVLIEFFNRKFPKIIEYNTKKYTSAEPDFVDGTGESKGLELLINYLGRNIELVAAYTHSVTIKTINGISFKPRYDKPHDFSLQSRFVLSNNWQTGCHIVYQSGAPFTRIIGYYSQNLPSYGYGSSSDEIPVFSAKNTYHYPAYYRVDVNFIRSFTLRQRAMEFYLDLINITGRLNVLRYNDQNQAEIQFPPFITFGVRTNI